MRHRHPNLLRRLLPAFAFLIACAGTVAEAQDKPNCAPGLMRRDEAASGTLLLKTRTPGCYLGAPRVAADITVNVAGPVARTRVTQRFHNPSDGWIEGVYLFPLPDGAAVDTLKLRIGSRLIEGDVKEKQEARQIYEEAKANGQRASLVEEDRPNVFTNQVANIGPHETVTVQIEYQESLRFEHGRYGLRIPLVVAPRYAPGNAPVADTVKLMAPVLRPEWGKVNPVRIRVNLEAGFPLGDVESRSHALLVDRRATSAAIRLRDGKVPADRDFTMSFAAAPGNAPNVSLLKETVAGTDYLLALIVPPAARHDVKPKPREAIFVLDNSGSMGGESIRQAKASLILALDRLHEEDNFNLIRFDDTLTVLFPRPVPASAANLAAAKAYVQSIDAAGGTEMLPALLAALNDDTPDDTSHVRQVIFLTDGDVSNEAELFSAIKQKLGRSRLFTVGIGSAPNMYFMSGAARAGRGTYTGIASIDEVAPRMAELFAKLERPVMTDISARWPQSAAIQMWPNPLPDLYDGEPVVIAARTANLQGQLVLSGKFAGQPWTTTLDLSSARAAQGIEKLWARGKIQSLEDSRVLGVDTAQIDMGVLATALEHHLTSRLTSLVAVDKTPRRPADEMLTRQDVPLNLPDGWDFDKVFGTDATPDLQHAEAVPANLLRELDTGHGASAVKPAGEAVQLPQGGTDSRLMFLIGLGLLLAASLLVRRTGTETRR
ncbi:MAG TPA: marine proteobacterial sortase target protein [Rhizomicrobium sp.]|nr:marine proteobacterial sortase target protein [Rhizomicrobium sp.]